MVITYFIAYDIGPTQATEATLLPLGVGSEGELRSLLPTVSIQLGFKVHIQSKLLQYTPVRGTHSSYDLGCTLQSRTVASKLE